jgi:hypothetical protein
LIVAGLGWKELRVFVVLVIIFLVIVALWVSPTISVYRDATERRRNPVGWTIACLVFTYIALAVWFAVRPSKIQLAE